MLTGISIIATNSTNWMVARSLIIATTRSRFGRAMTTMRQRTMDGSLKATRGENRQGVDSDQHSLVQDEIQKLQEELKALNERIAELENDGHRGHAMEVLKANAI